MLALAALLVASAALADVAPRPRPPAACTADSDCSISTFPGCCGSCCPVEPYAASNAQLSATRKRCAIIDCTMKGCEPLDRCAAVSSPSQWRAVCRSGQCERVAASADLEACSSDGDCVVTEVRCCPGCCEGGPRALTRAKLAREQSVCAELECSKPDCGNRLCKGHPAASAFRARCQEGRCELAAAQPPPPPPSSACRRDADCAVIYTGGRHDAACRNSPCGCCPGTTPVAVSVEQAGATPLTSSPGGGPAAEAPPFGLNQGKRPPAPNCSPCPGPPPTRAVCAGGQCALR